MERVKATFFCFRFMMASFQSLNLSPAILAKYQRRFNAIDLNKDGVITLREMAAVSKVFGYKLTIPELAVSDLYGCIKFAKLISYCDCVPISQEPQQRVVT